jgi:type IV secretory pathway VirB2 component (pilin)
MSDDRKSIGAGHDWSSNLFSFDFINSINIVGSSEVIESDNMVSSDHSVCIVGSGQRPVPFATVWFSPSIRVGQSFCWLSPHLPHSFELSAANGLDSPLGQTEESTAGWIGVVSTLAVILLVVAGIIAFFAFRRLSFASATSLPESETEAFTDSLFSLTAPDPFLSEQNALSSGVRLE